jgi:hypothetical protein
MKVTMEFNLPDDQAEYDVATMAWGMWQALLDFDNYLRARAKYEESDMINVDDVREHFGDTLWDNHVKLDKIP